MMYLQITYTDGSTKLMEAKNIVFRDFTNTLVIDHGEDTDVDSIFKIEIVFK